MTIATATSDERFMRACFELAAQGVGYVSPNPLVGAVLVVKGDIVAFGYHKQFGGPHAEVECLRTFSGDTADATLYVNLEPCSHYGKTPPCVDLILQRGIKRVMVAMTDPNPLVRGKGIQRLRHAGVDVRLGVLKNEAEYLNRTFIKHITTGLPYVHVKLAQTQDGFIAPLTGPFKYITSRESLTMVHRWRAEYDAVLVGATTIMADDPQLNVRLVTGRDPSVIVLDGRFSVSGREKVFSSARQRRVFLCVLDQALHRHRRKAAQLETQGVRILAFKSAGKSIPLRKLLTTLSHHNIASILVEGGKSVFSQFIQRNLVDELSVFVSQKTFRQGIEAFTPAAKRKVDRWVAQKNLQRIAVGSDHVFTGKIQ